MSKPYVFLALLLAVSAAEALAAGSDRPLRTAAPPSRSRTSLLETSTKSGIEHLYNLEHDQAIADFERAVKEHPDDPFAINHLAQAVLLKELYRLNALDTTLYADNGFLTGKPLPGDARVKAELFQLLDRSIQLCEARIRRNNADVDAYYARGVARGLRLSYAAIVEKSFFSALRNASASRSDHERVLQLDLDYVDAKLVIGVHNFVVGSMPMAAKIMAGIVGLTGSKKRGLDYLYEVARANRESGADARAALALFLRREGKYDDALQVQQELTARFPRNFLFALEEANLLKDAGRGADAAAAYSRILDRCKTGVYTDPHVERAAFGLGEVLKGQRYPEAALQHYMSALAAPAAQPDVRLRALLSSGQMYDVLQQRPAAISSYRAVLAADGDSPQAAAARRFLKEPYSYPK
jgi:tetratricopeptide (TPR) repeat protein